MSDAYATRRSSGHCSRVTSCAASSRSTARVSPLGDSATWLARSHIRSRWPGRARQAEEHLEPLRREVALVGQTALERGREACVRLEEETGGGEPLVVQMEAAGAALRP